MKAVVCKELGMADKLELSTDWPDPEIGEQDVLIDVKAAGLNFPEHRTARDTFRLVVQHG